MRSAFGAKSSVHTSCRRPLLTLHLQASKIVSLGAGTYNADVGSCRPADTHCTSLEMHTDQCLIHEVTSIWLMLHVFPDAVP